MSGSQPEDTGSSPVWGTGFPCIISHSLAAVSGTLTKKEGRALMSEYRIVFLSAVLSICLASCNLSAENEGEKMTDISLQLEAIEPSVTAGVVPKFQLTLRNEGKAAVKVLDIRDNRRVDLQDTYYDLEIRRGKELVKLPRAISDPGPISDDDFTSLGAGAKLSFKLTRFALALEELPPGKYKARVQFWKDPFQTSKTSCYYSSEAEFTVEK